MISIFLCLVVSRKGLESLFSSLSSCHNFSYLFNLGAELIFFKKVAIINQE